MQAVTGNNQYTNDGLIPALTSEYTVLPSAAHQMSPPSDDGMNYATDLSISKSLWVSEYHVVDILLNCII